MDPTHRDELYGLTRHTECDVPWLDRLGLALKSYTFPRQRDWEYRGLGKLPEIIERELKSVKKCPTSLRFLSKEQAGAIVENIKNRRVSPDSGETVRELDAFVYVAQSILLSLPLETLQFAKLLEDVSLGGTSHSYKDACKNNKGINWGVKLSEEDASPDSPSVDSPNRNYLSPLIRYLGVLSHCGTLNLNWDHPNLKKAKGITLETFKALYPSPPEQSEDDADKHKELPTEPDLTQHQFLPEPQVAFGFGEGKASTELPANIANDSFEETVNIDSILLAEWLSIGQLFSVASSMSLWGIQVGGAAANVQLLNTYVDLVQRGLEHLKTITSDLVKVKDEQQKLFSIMTSTLVVRP